MNSWIRLLVMFTSFREIMCQLSEQLCNVVLVLKGICSSCSLLGLIQFLNILRGCHPAGLARSRQSFCVIALLLLTVGRSDLYQQFLSILLPAETFSRGTSFMSGYHEQIEALNCSIIWFDDAWYQNETDACNRLQSYQFLFVIRGSLFINIQTTVCKKHNFSIFNIIQWYENKHNLKLKYGKWGCNAFLIFTNKKIRVFFKIYLQIYVYKIYFRIHKIYLGIHL